MAEKIPATESLMKRLAAFPPGAGHCVSMIEYRGRVIIACQFGVFEYHPDTREAGAGVLEQLMFVNAEEGMVVGAS